MLPSAEWSTLPAVLCEAKRTEPLGGPLEDFTAEKYHRGYNVNVLGLLLITKAALPLFPPAGGSIINIGLRVNTVVPAKSVISSASKAAVDAIHQGAI
jgi:3-oxoacyl-[acyl-carrier protein] reductase